MKMKIQKGLSSLKFKDENGNILATISNQTMFGKGKNIIDKDGQIVYTTNIINLPKVQEEWNLARLRKYVIFENTRKIAIANLFLSKNLKRRNSLAFWQRPSQIDKMDVDTPFGLWVVTRQPNNGVIVAKNGETIGSIAPFFTCKPQFFEFSSKYDIAFMVGIFSLASYMMNEEDLIEI
ncbi:MAG: hypothetical protein RR458_05515 [Clostridia bacterium]